MKKTSSLLLYIFIAAAMLSSASLPASIAHAVGAVGQTTYTVLSPLPCVESPASRDDQGRTIPAVTCGGTGKLVQNVDIKGYVQYMFNLFIAVAAVASVFVLVLGGFIYMTTDAVGGKEEGKEKIKHALQGLILILCSWLILKTINPQFVEIPIGLVTPLGVKGANFNNLDPTGDARANNASAMYATNQSIQENQSRIDELNEQIGQAEMDGDPNGDLQAMIDEKNALQDQVNRDVTELADQTKFANAATAIQQACNDGAGVFTSGWGAISGGVGGVVTSPSSLIPVVGAPINGVSGAVSGYDAAQQQAASTIISNTILGQNGMASTIQDPQRRADLASYAQRAMNNCASLQP